MDFGCLPMAPSSSELHKNEAKSSEVARKAWEIDFGWGRAIISGREA
jgi:hypothetical protein